MVKSEKEYDEIIDDLERICEAPGTRMKYATVYGRKPSITDAVCPIGLDGSLSELPWPEPASLAERQSDRLTICGSIVIGVLTLGFRPMRQIPF